MANEWWDPEGKFKPLHKFNPIRIKYIKENIINKLKLKKNNNGIVYLENNKGLKLEAKLVAKDTVLFTDASGNEVQVKKIGDKFQITQAGTVKYFRPNSTKVAVNK